MATASSSSSSGIKPSATDLTPLWKSLISASPTSGRPRPNPHTQPPSNKASIAKQWQRNRHAEQEWNAEVKKLHQGVRSLTSFIKGIRRAYLGLASGSGAMDEDRWDQKPRDFHEDGIAADEAQGSIDGGTSTKKPAGLDTWLTSTNLKEEQKDEVDLHVKMVVDKCVAKLKALKGVEEARLQAQPPPTSSSLMRLLTPVSSPLQLDSPAYSSQLGIHREVILSQIGSELKRVGEKIGLMQEARKRLLEEKMGKRRVGPLPSSSRVRGDDERNKVKALPGSTGSFKATFSPGAATSVDTSAAAALESRAKPIQQEEELTQAQLQLFENESSALTRTLQSDLASINNITSTLNEISSLQSTLISHLSMQNEQISHLGDQGIENRIEVEKGNTELKRAKERNRSANRLLGALLVGSGLGLLFLHGESIEVGGSVYNLTED